jgi:hypothetical protein
VLGSAARRWSGPLPVSLTKPTLARENSTKAAAPSKNQRGKLSGAGAPEAVRRMVVMKEGFRSGGVGDA